MLPLWADCLVLAGVLLLAGLFTLEVWLRQRERRTLRDARTAHLAEAAQWRGLHEPAPGCDRAA